MKEDRKDERDIDRLVDQFREIDRQATSDLEKLAAIQREFRSLSDNDIPMIPNADEPSASDAEPK